MNRIYKFNEAEGVFFPAFDKHICDDSQLSVNEGTITRTWDSLSIQGGKAFTVTWQGEAEIGTYDRFVCFISAGSGAKCTAHAVADGKRIELFQDAAGETVPSEWSGELPQGKPGILSRVELHLTFQADQNTVSLSWMGLANTEKLAALEKKAPGWEEAWCQEIHRDVTASIEKNLIFTPEEGEALRARIKNDPLLLAQIREEADKAMQIGAEEQMREYAPVGEHMYRFVRVRDRGRISMEPVIRNLAVAGYVLEEPIYSVHAAKLILALIHMKWFEGPVCEMEGSKFHHVCFTEDHMLTEVSIALGFLGGIFTESALEQIVNKIEEAWLFVKKKCEEPGYRNYMNQGLVGLRGVMIGAAFLDSRRGGYARDIENAYQEHCRLVQNYLTEEGHCAEGSNYFEYSFASSILLWHVYAKQVGKDVKEIVPDRFKRSGKYLEAITSCGYREGIKLPLNCGALQAINMLLLTFMTAVCDFPEGNNYLIARLANQENAKAESGFDLMFYEHYKAQINPHPYYRPIEEEISFPGAGLLTYRKGSTKLLVSAERNPLTAHCHEDRGGILLEAEGEVLLPELGTSSYANPVCLLMHKKEYHNLACPVDLEMVAESEIGATAAAMAAYPITEELTLEDMAIPEAQVLYHEKSENGYAFAVETGMLFGENIQGIRQGKLSGQRLELRDTWRFPKEHPIQVTFMSYYPWEIKEEGKLAVSGMMTLSVTAQEETWFETESGMIDAQGKAVYVLRIKTKEADFHEITSCITWKNKELSEDNSGAENRRILQELLDRGGTIRIEKQGIYEIEDTLYIKSNTHLIFGKGVVLKRAASGIGSFLLTNRGAFTRTYDENITIEGLHIITNGVEARYNAAVYGLTGEVSLFYVKHLRIFDFCCMDLPKLSYGIHICTFEDIVLERLQIEGRKDAVHLGTGSKFVIRHGLFRTFDDPIALNAHDYAVANPQMGWIEDGLIEDCYDLADKDTTGYFCRILAGSWVDWYEGMEIQNSDTVVSDGRVYRAFQKPDGVFYKSMTPPTHKEGMCTLDGIHWVMVQENVVYQCGCRNIHFKDIHLQKVRETALSIHFDHDKYSRSVYPGSVMPVQENLVFENMVIQNEIGCIVRSITPVDTVKICNSVIEKRGAGNSVVHLETLPGQEGNYEPAQILLQGNTCCGNIGKLVQCQDGRAYELIQIGNLIR